MNGQTTQNNANSQQQPLQEAQNKALQGDLQAVVDIFTRLFDAEPDNRLYREKFIQTLRSVRIVHFDSSPRDLFQKCLDDDVLDLTLMGGRWLRMVRDDKLLGPFFEALDQNSYEEFKKAFAALEDYSALQDPFFIGGIKKLIVSVPAFERFMFHLRRAMLEDLDDDHKLLPRDCYIALCEALSIYCYETDYIFFITPDEKQAVQDLKHYVESMGDDADIAGLCILACYGPLAMLETAQQIAEKYQDSQIADLIQRQIIDVYERYEIQNNIPALTKITNNVSHKVRQQYESFPYPRWRGLNIETIAEENRMGARDDGAGTKLLVAGCGTGWEAAEIACAFPKAEILSVDLSLASLSYAIQRTRKLGIENITFKQADILQLAGLDEQFDYIASSGVLHHMEDPVKGWQVLTDLLKPGCVMRIGLYAANARKSVTTAQNIIKEKKFGPDIESIRRFRAQAMKFLSKEMYQDITTIRDYYVAAECCDLLFHVQEQQFTLPRIKKILEFLKLNFVGIFLPPLAREDYLKKYPDDQSGSNLDNWIAYEQQNPDTFVEMYRFWCQKQGGPQN